MGWTELKAIGAGMDHIAQIIWREDARRPSWYQDALMNFTETSDQFADFLHDDAQEVWMLNSAEAFVIIERQERPDTIKIHLRIYGGDIPGIFQELQNLRDIKYNHGVIYQQGFVYARNRRLLAELDKIGFVDRELRMDYGTVAGRPAQWVLVEANMLEITKHD